jgi:hypothetical protein
MHAFNTGIRGSPRKSPLWNNSNVRLIHQLKLSRKWCTLFRKCSEAIHTDISATKLRLNPQHTNVGTVAYASRRWQLCIGRIPSKTQLTVDVVIEYIYILLKFHHGYMFRPFYSAILRPIQNISYTEVYSIGSLFVLHNMIKVPLMG